MSIRKHQGTPTSKTTQSLERNGLVHLTRKHIYDEDSDRGQLLTQWVVTLVAPECGGLETFANSERFASLQ